MVTCIIEDGVLFYTAKHVMRSLARWLRDPQNVWKFMKYHADVVICFPSPSRSKYALHYCNGQPQEGMQATADPNSVRGSAWYGASRQGARECSGIGVQRGYFSFLGITIII